jgi:hypothetical protein
MFFSSGEAKNLGDNYLEGHNVIIYNIAQKTYSSNILLFTDFTSMTSKCYLCLLTSAEVFLEYELFSSLE